MVETRRRRRRGWIVALVVVGVLVIGALVVPMLAGGPPGTRAASAYLTERVARGTVAQAVTASGVLADELTYAVAPNGSPTLVAQAAVASTAASGTASGAAGGWTTRSVAVTAGQRVGTDTELAVVRDGAGHDHTVKAPIGGRVREVSTAKGAAVSRIAVIGAGHPVAAVDVSEIDVRQVAAKQRATVAVGDSGTAFRGAVTSIAQTADDGSGVRKYRVLIDPEALPGGVRIGMSVTATIAVATHADVLTVPATAVGTSGSASTVQVLGKDGTARTVRVGIGLVGGGRVEITRGLAVGQRVVTGKNGTAPTVSTGGPRAPGF